MQDSETSNAKCCDRQTHFVSLNSPKMFSSRYALGISVCRLHFCGALIANGRLETFPSSFTMCDRRGIELMG